MESEVTESDVGGETSPDSEDSSGRTERPPHAQSTSHTEPVEEQTQAGEKRTHRRGAGYHEFGEGITPLEEETMAMLLQPNVRTYEDAAERLGISKWAVEKRMQRVYWRYFLAKSYCNKIEQFRRDRRAHKKGSKA